MTRRRRQHRSGGSGRSGTGHIVHLEHRDVQAEAQATLDALDVALSIARRTYQVDVQFVSDAELWRHADLAPRTDRQLLAVGCTLQTAHLSSQVRLSWRVLERLGAVDVRSVDVLRGEQLRGCLLGVAASLTPQHVHRRAARFVGEAVGETIVVRELGHASICAICLADDQTWQTLVGRNRRRREIEQALRENRRVFVDASLPRH